MTVSHFDSLPSILYDCRGLEVQSPRFSVPGQPEGWILNYQAMICRWSMRHNKEDLFPQKEDSFPQVGGLYSSTFFPKRKSIPVMTAMPRSNATHSFHRPKAVGKSPTSIPMNPIESA